MNTRATAATLIYHVIVLEHSLDQALSEVPLNHFTSADQRFIHELCYGTLRFYHQLMGILTQLLHKPLENKHRDVLCVLLIGLYQLIHLDTPAYAAISSTVDAVKTLKKSWAAGLINKILRLCLQKKAELLAFVEKNDALRYSHPQWLVKKIQADWPSSWAALLEANNVQAPLVLRINPQKTTIENYQKLLATQNKSAETIEGLPYALMLHEPAKVTELPGFAEGFFYVQDSAGQHTAKLLQLREGLEVLDACAAPGSKTTDLLISEPHLARVVALDKSFDRLKKIKENMDRLQLSHHHVQLIKADATKTTSFWDQKPFDRILLDAPCSATGVIRRHPDIKVLRLREDIQKQAEQQYTLIKALWPLLKPEGLLLYSTCSILKEENEQVLHLFLQHHQEATSLPIKIKGGINLTHGCQLLPSIKGCDGFYYALLTKKP